MQWLIPYETVSFTLGSGALDNDSWRLLSTYYVPNPTLCISHASDRYYILHFIDEETEA